MAYPALLVSPFVYHINYRAQEQRQRSRPNVFTFAAATGDEASILTALSPMTVGQAVSVNHRIGAHNVGAAHPGGTRYSVVLYGRSALGAVWKAELRNVNPAAVALDFQALLLGTVSPSGLVAALSTAPLVPSSLEAVTTASSLIRQLS